MVLDEVTINLIETEDKQRKRDVNFKESEQMSSSELLCISLLRDCKTLNNLKQIHAFASKTGFLNDPFVAGKLLLLSSVSISNALDYACRLLLQIPSPDIFMYNTLIRGFSESNCPQQALLTYIKMRHSSYSPSPDSFSFAFVLKATANYKSLKSGIQIHSQSLTHGFDTHLFVRTTLVSMYAECGCFVSARKAFDEIPQPNVVAWNAVVTACFRCGDVSGAQKLFGEMPFQNLTSWNLMLAGYMKAGKTEPAKRMFMDMRAKDSVSWSTMIVGFAHNGNFDEAFCFFREMRVFGMRPNEVSLTGVLSACAQAGALEFGKILHGYIEKAGFGLIVSISNALLDTYSRCGNVGMACLVFDQMMIKNTVTWTSMIAGFAMHGFGEEAIQLFHEMEESGMKPDSITFISILYACSHAGLIEQGSHFFHEMQETYAIEPSVEHYGCMVDLYGRAGLLNQAYEFVIQMPIEPNEIIWRTLLGACSIHGDVELAEQVKEQLSQLDPNNSGDHVLLSNIYAVAGKWKDAAAVRRSMTDRNIKKAPGWSMIEVDKIMYGFVVGEAINGVTEEAYNKLAEILSRIRVEGGYTPEIASVLHDIEEEEKESAVTMHSEKLAVAFGMSRLSQGIAIRVVKNLRVCRDCHTVMKLISKIYRQEITLRDRNRFHLFQEGHCSCRDYW